MEAILAFVGVIIGAALTAYFNSRSELFKKNSERREVASLARHEELTLLRHTRANLIKLHSLREKNSLGKRVDYEKLRFFSSDFAVADMKRIYLLADNLSQDLLRMRLFARNNELEIDNAIEVLFRTDSATDDEKWEIVVNLIERMTTTAQKLEEITRQLLLYEKSPKTYREDALLWSDSLFEFKGNSDNTRSLKALPAMNNEGQQ